MPTLPGQYNGGRGGVVDFERQYWNDKINGQNLRTNTNSPIDPKDIPSLQLMISYVNSAIAGVSTQSLTMQAGEALGGSRVVIANGGQAYYANQGNTAHAGKVIGLTQGAAASGAAVTILTQAYIDDGTFSFTPGQAVYFTGLGVLTTTPPTSGFIQQVGVALTATRLLVNLAQPIILT